MAGLTRKGFVKAFGLAGLAGLFMGGAPLIASKINKAGKSIYGSLGLSWNPGKNSVKKNTLISKKFGRNTNTTY